MEIAAVYPKNSRCSAVPLDGEFSIRENQAVLSNSMLTLPLSRAGRNFSRSLAGAALGSLFLLSGSTCGNGDQDPDVRSAATNSVRTAAATNSHSQPKAIVQPSKRNSPGCQSSEVKLRKVGKHNAIKIPLMPEVDGTYI